MTVIDRAGHRTEHITDADDPTGTDDPTDTEDPTPMIDSAPDDFRFTDELGPAKIVHITERTTGLRATVVIDNVAIGQAIGGVRMAVDVTTEECFGLARAMTLKNAAAGLAHGGGKAVIVGDPLLPHAQKEPLIRAFARAIADLTEYAPGPDMGTTEVCMAWIKDEIGRAIGLPEVLGGIPLDEIGATGFGLAASIDVAAEHIGMDLAGARVAVQGFGAVGKAVCRFLTERGCIIVAVVDSGGGVVDRRGLDVDDLIRTNTRGSVAGHPAGDVIDRDAIVGVECDIWIPAARPNILHAGNADQLRARIFAQGANIPATPEAEARLHERGIVSLPDFIANAGGVICGAVEYAGGTKAEALETIDTRIRANTAAMLERSAETGELPRAAAMHRALERIEAAMAVRRHQ